MDISPAIASGNLLLIEEEVAFADCFFNSLHLDIEDGVAVSGITFGTKMCQLICDASTAAEKSIHLEVWRPLDYLEEVRKCNANHVFIQTAHLSEAQQVIQIYQQAGIPTGISINVLDQSRPDFYALLTLADEILVATAYPDDPEQCYQNEMEKLALKLAAEGKKVWIDGGVTAEIYSKLADSSLTAAVMGRAVFKNKEQAVKQFCQNR